MRLLLVLVAAASLTGGCLPDLWVRAPSLPATGSQGPIDKYWTDPVLLMGGAGLLLAMVGGLAGLIACQTENCLGQKDPNQADSSQVKYGYPMMNYGLAIGLPLYFMALVLETQRVAAEQRGHFTVEPEPTVQP